MGRIDLQLSFPGGLNVTDESAIPRKLSADTTVSQVEHVESIPESPVAEACDDGADIATASYDFQPRSRRMEDLPFIDRSEVARRDGMNGQRLWIVVDNVVLDVTSFQHRHPAGKSIIQGFGGLDCSWQWWSFHSQQIMQSWGLRLRIGRTDGVPNKYERPARKQFPLRVAGEQW